MFDISDRIEPLELSDVFYRLEELLEQDQFELIFPEYKHKHEFQKQQENIRRNMKGRYLQFLIKKKNNMY